MVAEAISERVSAFCTPGEISHAWTQRVASWCARHAQHIITCTAGDTALTHMQGAKEADLLEESALSPRSSWPCTCIGAGKTVLTDRVDAMDQRRGTRSFCLPA